VKKKRFLFFIGIFSVLFNTSLSADSEVQNWLQINQTLFLNRSLSVFTEIHPRVSLSEGELSSFIARFALQYQIGSFNAGAGSLWQTSFFPAKKNEVRHFLQGVYSHTGFIASDFSHRVRVEERSFNDSTQKFYRLRYQLRSTHSWFDSDELRALLANEIFLNLNSSEKSGPVSGLDQNRFFVGVNIRWSDKAASDLAYLFNYVKRSASQEGLINHILFYSLNINL